ncbi:ZIP-like iron-zinc transporter [Russula earlei]|uniref:ZIP-like iron-zinc transporter n=1 Tax=Russula earlei TaxID=71964 RepID=A0ACC0U7P5_9AGAM|nr:ZIP-like iron-zinc transporter [Russula earlei]
MSDLNCGSGGGSTTFHGLRIASVFIIWVTSSFAATFPVVARRSRRIYIPTPIFETAKYFGSGVIIATAFIHLLSPGVQELTSPCLAPAWQDYPYAFALALLSSLGIFIIEIIAFRIGTAKLKELGITHGHGAGALSASASGHEVPLTSSDPEKTEKDHEVVHTHGRLDKQGSFVSDEDALAQLIGVAILEFGVILHSVLIGLTLAVDERFKVLFIVVIFHQMFEGLGVGSRLAFLVLPHKYRHVPYLGSFLYGITTPIGIAAGLGVQTTYNPGSTRATMVSGILDSLSAGILLYTGFVELLAHEFLFNAQIREVGLPKLLYNLGCMMLGVGLMALLGKWA